MLTCWPNSHEPLSTLWRVPNWYCVPQLGQIPHSSAWIQASTISLILLSTYPSTVLLRSITTPVCHARGIVSNRHVMLPRHVIQNSPRTSRVLKYSLWISSQSWCLATKKRINYLWNLALGDDGIHLRVPTLCFLRPSISPVDDRRSLPALLPDSSFCFQDSPDCSLLACQYLSTVLGFPLANIELGTLLPVSWDLWPQLAFTAPTAPHWNDYKADPAIFESRS